MSDPILNPLFRRQDVDALASHLSDAGEALLHTREFRAACTDLERKRISGEANTREKIIEPILYEILGFHRSENDAEHAVNHPGAGGSAAQSSISSASAATISPWKPRPGENRSTRRTALTARLSDRLGITQACPIAVGLWSPTAPSGGFTRRNSKAARAR